MRHEAFFDVVCSVAFFFITHVYDVSTTLAPPSPPPPPPTHTHTHTHAHRPLMINEGALFSNRFEFGKGRKVSHAPGMPGTFSHHQLQRKPLVNDHGIYHGTCVTHVPWCMSGLLNRGGGENVPGIPGACSTRNFAHLARGPWFLWLSMISNTFQVHPRERFDTK